MNAPRNINAPVFTTLMCACLGLLVVGTPLQAHARAALTEASQSTHASVICSGFEASVVASLQELNVEPHWLPAHVSQADGQTPAIFYQNTIGFVPSHQVLIVTRLARAALSDLPEKQSKAFRVETKN